MRRLLLRIAPLAALVAAVLATAVPGELRAQEAGEPRPARLTFDVEEARLDLTLGDLLEDGGLRRALDQGLPLRVKLRAELWRDGFFDRQEAAGEWGASVILDPVAREYEVAVQDIGVIARTVTLGEAARTLEAAFDLELRPGRQARYYVLGVLEIETLSLSDLDELRRWLGGDVASAVRGEEGAENAVATGVRRIFVRALGLPARRERLRTPTFAWGGQGPLPPGPGGSAPAALRSAGRTATPGRR